MLNVYEKVLFTLLALGALVAALRAADRIRRIVRRGRGDIRKDVPADRLYQRAVEATLKATTLSPTWRVRFWPSLFHAMVRFGSDNGLSTAQSFFRSREPARHRDQLHFRQESCFPDGRLWES